LPPASKKASSRIEADEKVRKSSKPVATTEACLVSPGMVRLGMRVPPRARGVPRRLRERLAEG
jgi:hypothetical protein